MVTVPAAPFEPDKSRYNLGAANEIVNVIPVADGWAPQAGPNRFIPALEVLTDELGNYLTDENGSILVELVSGASVDGDIFLTETPRGGIFVRLENGTSALFVGTETKLYSFNFADYYWEDVSGASAPYATADRWSFCRYGTTIYAQNGVDTPQKIEVGVDTVFSDNAGAPIAKYNVAVADFVMLGNLASDPAAIRWSALNDPTSYVYLDRFSDSQVFGEGNSVQGILEISSGALVFLRDAIYLMVFPDSEYVFRRQAVTEKRGAFAPGSICSIGQDDFIFYAADGFFRGLGMDPIGAEKVDRFILDACDQTARQNMICASDYRRKIAWFKVNTTSGTPLLLGYQWQLGRWCLSNADLVDMFACETVGLTIGALPNLFPTFEDLTIPFNSSLFDGGSFEFAGIDSDGALVYMNGDNLEAVITTNEFTPNGVDRAFVNGGRLAGDAANYSSVLITADFKGASSTERNAVAPSSRTGFLPFRGSGRVIRVRTTIPAGEDWTIFEGHDLNVVAAGKS